MTELFSYIIHDSDCLQRADYVAEARRQIPNLLIMPAVHDPMSGYWGATRAHQNVIAAAKLFDLPVVNVLEDDVRFTEHFSYEKWRELAFWLLDSPFSLLLGGVVTPGRPVGRPESGIVEVSQFCGCHLMLVKADLFDSILQQSHRTYIDQMLSELPVRKVVTVPFLATQHDGYSFSGARNADLSRMFAKAELYLETR